MFAVAHSVFYATHQYTTAFQLAKKMWLLFTIPSPPNCKCLKILQYINQKVKHEKSKLLVHGLCFKFKCCTWFWITSKNSPLFTGLEVWTKISKLTKVSISVTRVFSSITEVSIFCGIIWRIKVRTRGHLRTFFTISMLDSIEYHSPGPIFKTSRLGHSSRRVVKLGMFNNTSFNTPSHFPSSPNAMQGMSRNTLLRYWFPITRSESATNLDAPYSNSCKFLTLTNLSAKLPGTPSRLIAIGTSRLNATYFRFGAVIDISSGHAIFNWSFVKLGSSIVTTFAFVESPKHRIFSCCNFMWPVSIPNTPKRARVWRFFILSLKSFIASPFILTHRSVKLVSSRISVHSLVSMHMFLRSIVFKWLPVQKNYIKENPSQIDDRLPQFHELY